MSRVPSGRAGCPAASDTIPRQGALLLPRPSLSSLQSLASKPVGHSPATRRPQCRLRSDRHLRWGLARAASSQAPGFGLHGLALLVPLSALREPHTPSDGPVRVHSINFLKEGSKTSCPGLYKRKPHQSLSLAGFLPFFFFFKLGKSSEVSGGPL